MTTIAAYTPYRWDHALVVLRLAGPCAAAGVTVLRGTDGSTVRPELVSQADLVLIQRDFPRDTAGYTQVTAAARAHGKPIIFDLDDLLLELPPDHPDRAIQYYTDALVPMLHAIVTADAVTASTSPLCDYLRNFNPHVWLLPNYLEDTLWPLRTTADSASEGPVTIGYMGGGSHMPDLAAIAPVLQKLAGEYNERIRFRFWGGAPPPGLAGMPNVEWTDLSLPYPELAAYFSEQICDLFIAPLQDNLFNRCKSAVKFLEYSALGVPGVYSQITPYQAMVVHGQNGFLAATRPEWETFLRQLIDSPALRSQLGAQAQKTVRARGLLSDHAQIWAQTYQEILDLGPGTEGQADAREVAGRMFALHEEVQAGWRQEQAAWRADLVEKDRAIEAIHSSAAWKIGVRLAPAGSRREKALRALARLLRS
jgi:glycosyltransferase involved in cell wall biosynthesis